MLARSLEAELPDASRMQAALGISASAPMRCVYDAILVFALLAHDVASYSSSLACAIESLQPLWSGLDSLYAWAQDALLVCNLSTSEGCNLLRVRLEPFAVLRNVLTKLRRRYTPPISGLPLSRSSSPSQNISAASCLAWQLQRTTESA